MSLDSVFVAQLDAPETLSAVAQVTDTFDVYHPLLPSVPEGVPDTVGGETSRFTVTEAEAVRPAPLVVVQL